MTISVANLTTRLGKDFVRAKDMDAAVLAGTYRGDPEIRMSGIRSSVQNTCIDMADADTPIPGRDLRPALEEIFRQFVASGDSFDGTTVSATATASAGNIGNGAMIVNVDDLAANEWMFIRPESLILRCVEDERVAGDARRARFQIKGAAPVPYWDSRWPRGSGYDRTVNQTCTEDVEFSEDGRNILNNSGFETFVSGLPTQWLLVTGVAGVDISSTTTSHRGTTALKITGDGATLSKIRQPLGDATGTLGNLVPGRPHVLSFWIRHDGSAPAAGVLKVSIANSAGATQHSAEIDVTLSGISGTYVHKSVVFQVPKSRATGLYCEVELTTALTNTEQIFIDSLQCAPMFSYAGYGSGLSYLIVPGSTAFAVDDYFTIAVTNNNEGEFVRFLDRFCDLYALGLNPPQNYGGTETIVDGTVIA